MPTRSEPQVDENADVKQTLERATGIVENTLRAMNIDPESARRDDGWQVQRGSDTPVVLRLLRIGAFLHLAVSTTIARLPFDNIESFYRRLLELNRPDQLRGAKLFLDEDLVIACHVQPAPSLDPVEVQAAMVATAAGADRCHAILSKEFPNQPTV